MHIEKGADEQLGPPKIVGPHPHPAAHPAPLASAGQHAGPALALAQAVGGAREREPNAGMVVGMHARPHRFHRVGQLVVGKAEQGLVARRIPDFVGVQVAFPDALGQAVEDAAGMAGPGVRQAGFGPRRNAVLSVGTARQAQGWAGIGQGVGR